MVRKFYASTTREALRQVRDALGADAIILSNRQVAGGVEIMAVADMDVASLTAHLPKGAAPVTPVPEPTAARHEPEIRPFTPPRLNPVPSSPTAASGSFHSDPPSIASAPRQAGNLAPRQTPDVEASDTQEIFKEIRFLRGLLEGQLAGFAWSDMQRRDPARIEVLRQMLALGFSPTMSRQIVDKMPPGSDAEKGVKWVKAALVHNLRTVVPGQDVVEAGGVYALVGPTGVGKTTTVAKLAARCTLRHGPEKVALLTTDSYRIGAHDQLKIYGRILGVPVYAVKDEAELQLTLADLQNRHIVLIDTVGMSQRDRRLAQQVALLCGNGREVKRLLLLNATSQGSTLDDVVRAYQGAGMEGCILTKVDEALSLGAALDVLIRHKLMLHYVANGQRVPEDIHLANPLYLIDRAFRSGVNGSAFALKDGDYPLVMAGAADETEERGYSSDALARGEGALRG
jgi:flagellar biosynthesis protein FlhF